MSAESGHSPGDDTTPRTNIAALLAEVGRIEAALEAEGEDTVRKRWALHSYPEDEAPIVRNWLLRKTWERWRPSPRSIPNKSPTTKQGSSPSWWKLWPTRR